MYIVSVITMSPPDGLFYYHSEGLIPIGKMVEVSFGAAHKIAIIIENDVSHELVAAFADKIKLVTKECNLPAFSANYVTFLMHTADYYITYKSFVFKSAIPQKIITHFFKKPVKDTDEIKLDLSNKVVLSSAQMKSKAEIHDQMAAGMSAVLLHGETASGKTEIYFSMIDDILAADYTAQILILLPEIALSSQFSARFKGRFGAEPTIWHSGLTEKQRRENFVKIVMNKTRVVVGARSAVLLAFSNLKLIVIDEEHDGSYKQEEKFLYNAKDLAFIYANLISAKILLVSATPSISTIYSARSNKIGYSRLAQKFFNDDKFEQSIEVSILDMREVNNATGRLLHSGLIAKMHEVLAAGKQILLFLNKKGYSPFLLCKHCGVKYECKYCDSWMVFYKAKNICMCHQCGSNSPYVNACKSCGKENGMITYGYGVEKLSEFVAALFPSARQLILTKDESDDFEEFKEKIVSIENREIDIIIGTQIITKGYHFKDIDLVGIVDADIGMNSAELRAAEETYQLLYQASGRTGREYGGGNVYIQTYNSKSKLLAAIAKLDYDEFANCELQSRKNAGMPPFKKIAVVIISGKDHDVIFECADSVLLHAPISDAVEIIGPIRSQILRVKNVFSYRIIVKYDRSFPFTKYMKMWLSKVKQKNGVKIVVDVNPYQLF